MDDAKLGTLGKVLGVVQILVAIFYLDPNNRNAIIVPVLLFLGGVLMLNTDIRSPLARKVRGVLAYNRDRDFCCVDPTGFDGRLSKDFGQNIRATSRCILDTSNSQGDLCTAYVHA